MLTRPVALVPAAGERLSWSGQNADGCRYRFHDGGHGRWSGTLTFRGETVTADFTEVQRCAAFIELRFEGQRERLYQAQYLIRRPDGRWLQMAQGQWHDGAPVAPRPG
jgi:hypothetical protein